MPFTLEGKFRRDETPAHKAIREALINTLIHADYQGPGGVRVLRDGSGYQFINPGLLLVSEEQLWRGGVSEARNPTLQHLFSLLTLGERDGSGGPAIRQAWVQQHWRAPKLWEDVENAETHLELRQVSLLPEEAIEALQARFGDRFAALDELGRLALVTAHAEGEFDHGRLMAVTNAHSRDVTLKLQELMRKGLLAPSGPSRPLRYTLPNEAGSGPSEAGSGGSEAGSSPGEPPADVLQVVRERSRAPAPLVEEAIVQACRGGFMTVDEIAKAIQRSPSTVRIRFLPRLVAAGRLILRHPGTPSHPSQAYRAAIREQP